MIKQRVNYCPFGHTPLKELFSGKNNFCRICPYACQWAITQTNAKTGLKAEGHVTHGKVSSHDY